MAEYLNREDPAGELSWKEAEAAVPRGRYRHFKGNEYEVLFIARHSETLEPLVVYRALYQDGGVWARPVRMWLEEVLFNGKSVPRFERVSEEAK